MAGIFTHFSFFFTDTATTEIYTLSLHDALPIYSEAHRHLPTDVRGQTLIQTVLLHSFGAICLAARRVRVAEHKTRESSKDRKSTRLNSSHSQISYAVFCLKKKRLFKSTENYTMK